MAINHTLFIPLFAVACLTFGYSCWQRLQLVAAGSGEDRFDNPGARLAHPSSGSGGGAGGGASGSSHGTRSAGHTAGPS